MADEVIKFIFREAKLTDSILFFDECEQIFLSREKGGREVNLLLTEIERHDGLIIMVYHLILPCVIWSNPFCK